MSNCTVLQLILHMGEKYRITHNEKKEINNHHNRYTINIEELKNWNIYVWESLIDTPHITNVFIVHKMFSRKNNYIDAIHKCSAPDSTDTIINLIDYVIKHRISAFKALCDTDMHDDLFTAMSTWFYKNLCYIFNKITINKSTHNIKKALKKFQSDCFSIINVPNSNNNMLYEKSEQDLFNINVYLTVHKVCNGTQLENDIKSLYEKYQNKSLLFKLFRNRTNVCSIKFCEWSSW